MAVGMTFVIITGGIDLSVGATYAIASAYRALVLSQFGAEGGTGSVLLGILVTIGVGILGGYSMDR
jgi:ribose/xylose/arabinose/galactoside ABC-type transport system permease subunit